MDTDAQRWALEDQKRSQPVDGERARNPFARDRARVLHSYAFRRLADKTQVVSPGQDDFPRTRLTHSLEVAQIAREIGAALGCDADITDTAGLAHDLGHPPFGHNGEDALDEVAAGIGGFEGNAQTFRILTRLEAKVLTPDGRSAGLNLTRAGLDAVCKYPWPRRTGYRKFGVYASDLAAFDWVRASVREGHRCLEAQIMDWADDVAYSVHDVEDGVHAGHIRLSDIDRAERLALCRVAAASYSELSAADLLPYLEGLLALPACADLAGYDGSFEAQIAAKRATSELTGRFAGSAVSQTRRRYGTDPLGRYTAELIVAEQIAAECALLKAIALRYVMRRDGVAELLSAQRQLLAELVKLIYNAGLDGMSRAMQAAYQQAASPDERLRVVVDQVAQLTDSAAVTWHQRLSAVRVSTAGLTTAADA
ncbi:deoxyguanosinetriphosphate triphosphohydrolase [Jatrophihabitans telluris]|uniref:deoxyguanosinetriphosphate triphosphohydrolase n=1 Tax=Jatrophihabitans telluris TaxID=2038343 RepID=UPI003D3228EC